MLFKVILIWFDTNSFVLFNYDYRWNVSLDIHDEWNDLTFNSHPLEDTDYNETRIKSNYDNLDELSSAFKVKHTNQSYQAQFASLYYLRLAKLKKLTQKRSIDKWSEIPGE